MMTTASPRDSRRSQTSPLLGATAGSLGLGLLATGLGAVAGGADAAFGALAGTLLAVGVFVLGSSVVDVVSRVMPAASLLVALLTYTLQVVLMALVFAALTGSGLLDDTLDRAWLGGTVIAVALLWTVAQVVLSTRLRIPAFEPVDGPLDKPVPAAAGARPEGGERPR